MVLLQKVCAGAGSDRKRRSVAERGGKKHEVCDSRVRGRKESEETQLLKEMREVGL